jgi:hypothetical protein
LSAKIPITRTPILPVITIQDNNGDLITWNHFLEARPFVLNKAQFKPQYLQSAGEFMLKIYDPNSVVIGHVRRGNEVTLWVGKTNDSLNKVMLGTITSMKFESSGPNEGYVTISGIDWGSYILKRRVIYYSWHQRLDSEGEPDITDTSVAIKNIVRDIIENEAVYPSTVTLANAGVIYDEALIDSQLKDLLIPQLGGNFQYIDDVLRTIDGIAISAHHGVNADKKFFMRRSVNNPSGILLVDDQFDVEAVTYGTINPGKVGAVSAEQPSTLEKTIEDYSRRIFGLGAGVDTRESGQLSTATFDNVSQYRAMKLLHDTEDQSVANRRGAFIGVYLSKSGTVQSDVILELIEDLGNKPKGSVIREIKLDKLAVQDTPKVHYFDLGLEELNTAKDYWIVLRLNGPELRWHREAASVDSRYTHATSTDGINWTVTDPLTASSYGYAFEYWYNRELIKSAEHGILTFSDYILPEEVVRQPEITSSKLMDAVFVDLTQNLFKEKWIYKCTMMAPDIMLENGQQVRIKITKSPVANFDFSNFVVTDLEYIFESDEQKQTGLFSIDGTFIRLAEPE